jgi:hypothetical protein
MTTVCWSKKSHTVYRPRRPEKTTLFEVVKKHYSTWNRNSKEPIPRYVDNEFQKYLGCGILAKGFAYAHCDGCQKDFLIAFSCKGRGICSSCNSRAMVETAAHLVDNVLPRLPFRQDDIADTQDCIQNRFVAAVVPARLFGYILARLLISFFSF